MTNYISALPSDDNNVNKIGHSNVSKFRKEKHYSSSLMVFAIRDNDIHLLIDSRFYHANSRAYNCTWITFDNLYISAGSYADGYGYHKASQTLENTFTKLGIDTQGLLGGRGDRPMEDALLELARKLNDKYKTGYTSFKIFQSHA